MVTSSGSVYDGCVGAGHVRRRERRGVRACVRARAHVCLCVYGGWGGACVCAGVGGGVRACVCESEGEREYM